MCACVFSRLPASHPHERRVSSSRGRERLSDEFTSGPAADTVMGWCRACHLFPTRRVCHYNLSAGPIRAELTHNWFSPAASCCPRAAPLHEPRELQTVEALTCASMLGRCLLFLIYIFKSTAAIVYHENVATSLPGRLRSSQIQFQHLIPVRRGIPKLASQSKLKCYKTGASGTTVELFKEG